VSILGERYSHGHVIDFYRQLLDNPHELRVLGNGKQRKSYLHVSDCVEAIGLAMQATAPRVAIFNLGQDEYCEVNDSLGWIARHLGLSPRLVYTGSERGWVGDNPFIYLDCTRMRALGWAPRLSIQSSVIRTLEFLQANHWLLQRRT
jgi:UDP-glucose 4-epimerase